MGLFSRGGSSYTAARRNESSSQSAKDVPGKLLRIDPYKDNEGMIGTARVLRSIHDVKMAGLLRRTNSSDHHTFEIWFDEGELNFFVHVATPDAAETITSRIESSYGNSDVYPVKTAGFPSVTMDDYVAGATLGLEQHHFYPIRQFREGRGFERDPYAEVTNEMLSTEDSSVVVQVVFRPEPTGWADDDGGALFGRGSSVDDVAEGLKQGQVTGWLNPHVRDPSKKDREAAKIIEQQRGKLAYNVTLRVMAISPDQGEAEARCKGVADMFARHYNATTEQGFTPSPVSPRQVGEFVTDCQRRTWTDQSMILTVDELAGVAHIPNDEVETPNIGWKTTQTSPNVSPNVAQHDAETDS